MGGRNVCSHRIGEEKAKKTRLAQPIVREAHRGWGWGIGAGIATALILGAIYRHQYRPCYYGYPYYGYSYYRPVYRGYYAGYYRPRWHYHHHRPYGHFYRRHRHC